MNPWLRLPRGRRPGDPLRPQVRLRRHPTRPPLVRVPHAPLADIHIPGERLRDSQRETVTPLLHSNPHNVPLDRVSTNKIPGFASQGTARGLQPPREALHVNRRRPIARSARGARSGRTPLLRQHHLELHAETEALLGVEHVGDDLLRKAPAREQPPGAGARRARARERPPRPRGLVRAVARRRDGLGDERLGEPARREIGGDAQAARPAGAELRGAVVGEPRVVDVAELAAAGDRGGRRRGAVAEADQTRRAREEPCGDVERSRRRAARTGRP